MAIDLLLPKSHVLLLATLFLSLTGVVQFVHAFQPHQLIIPVANHVPVALRAPSHLYRTHRDENDRTQEQSTSYSTLTSKPSIAISSRRRMIKSIAAITAAVPLQCLVSPPQNANAATQPSSADLPNGLLETRVLENVLSPPPYGIESGDVLYPSYFSGVWDVDSKTSDIIAPCGIQLFGGNNTYTRAQNEIGTSLTYKSRFIPTTATTTADETTPPTSPKTIADREYNVVEIAKSAMGNNAVLDVPLVTPNKVSVILSPTGANQIFQADLLTLNRRSEYISTCDFHCSEVVRQIIAPVRSEGGSSGSSNPNRPMAPSRSSSLLKEIETASLYTALKNDDGSVNTILCRQRSATFLLPSQQDPMAYKMWEACRGRPIDVRYYDIVYTKRA